MDYPVKKEYKLSKTQKIIFIALLVSQAIVLSFIERMIPLNFSIPGAKLGLANIITLTSLYLFSFKESLAIVILRTMITSFIVGSFSSFLYSISGGLLSFFVMYVLMQISFEKISPIGISIVGGVFHNLGQLLMAAFIIKNIRITYYLPFLMLTGVVTGCVVGITVRYLLRYLRKLNYFD